MPDQLRLTTSLLMHQDWLLLLLKIFGFPHLVPQPDILQAHGNTQLPHPKSLPQHQLLTNSLRSKTSRNLKGLQNLLGAREGKITLFSKIDRIS